MSRITSSVILASLLLVAAQANAFWFGPKTDSVWTDKPVVLDGKMAKWRPKDDDDDSGIVYAFANDAQNLYLMLYPHTKSAKDELAGAYEQDFTIWLDTQAGKGKTVGIRLGAPGNEYDYMQRDTEIIGIDSTTVAAPRINVGPVKERGIIEAAIPLVFLGKTVPEKISVGITTSPARKTPPHNIKKAGKDAARQDSDDSGVKFSRGHRGGGQRKRSGEPQDEDLTPLDLWIRVTMATGAPKTK
jgi:hypothetical protein